jgi:hypothetical protein
MLVTSKYLSMKRRSIASVSRYSGFPQNAQIVGKWRVFAHVVFQLQTYLMEFNRFLLQGFLPKVVVQFSYWFVSVVQYVPY